jgi:Protein of unknown function (DUF2510)
MSAIDQPPAPGGPPTVVQQTTLIQVGSHKSVGGAVALAFFFGPLGMLYATVPGACVMFFVNVLMLFGTAGIGLLLTVPLGMFWAGSAASSHNKRLGAATQAVSQSTPQSPAAWHPDPDGSDRQRYWDGRQWTSHYADNHNSAATGETAALTVSSDELVRSECGSCGGGTDAGHKFCPSCGSPRDPSAH